MVCSQDATARAVITDFGLAKSVGDGAPGVMTETDQVMGTPGYVAPEVGAGYPSSVASDVYALGVLILEMRTGRTSLPPPLSERGNATARLEPEWRSVVARCMSADPAQRYASAGGVLTALNRAHRNRPLRRRFLWVAAALALVTLSVPAIRFYRREPTLRQGAQIVVTPTANSTRRTQPGRRNRNPTQPIEPSLQVVNLWPMERLPQVLHAMGRADTPLLPADWREAAMRENVPLVVFSNLTKLGDAYSFDLRAEAIGSGPPRCAVGNRGSQPECLRPF